MKGYKYLIAIGVVALTAGGVFYRVNGVLKERNAYRDYLQTAREAAELSLVPKAVENYQLALNLQPSLDLMLEISDMYSRENLERQALTWADSIVSTYNLSESYENEMMLNIKYDNIPAAFQIYDEVIAKGKLSEDIISLYESIEYTYETSYRTVKEINGVSNGYWLANVPGYEGFDEWEYITANGTASTQLGFYESKDVGPTGLVAARPTEDSIWEYYDLDGMKQVSLEHLTDLTYIGFYNENLTLLAENFEYGFYNNEQERVLGPYIDATEFSNGIAFVLDANDQWSAIDTSGATVFSERYDEIITDANRIPSINGSFLARKGEQVYLYTYQGVPVETEQPLEDAKLFRELDGLAAVKINGKWGFMDKEGKIVIEPMYQNAKSSSHGLMAVQEDNGLWGLIDSKGTEAVEAVYKDIQPVSSSGTTFVMSDSSYVNWDLIQFYKDK